MEKIGATGKFPQGKVYDDDEGELQMSVTTDPRAKLVKLNFGKDISWLGLPADQAEALGKLLIARAQEVK